MAEIQCPLCKGQAYSKLHSKNGLEPCPLCNDIGSLDTEFVCECGRPAVRFVNEMLICMEYTCLERILKAPEQKEHEENSAEKWRKEMERRRQNASRYEYKPPVGYGYGPGYYSGE